MKKTNLEVRCNNFKGELRRSQSEIDTGSGRFDLTCDENTKNDQDLDDSKSIKETIKDHLELLWKGFEQSSEMNATDQSLTNCHSVLK